MPFHLTTLGFIICLLLLRLPTSASDIYSDALLGLKSELLDVGNGLADWFIDPGGDSVAPIQACSWSGITCDEKSSKIIRLDVSLKNLSGPLSGDHIAVLVDLVDLNLSHNSFSGSLPAEIFTLVNLRRLDISSNDFSGRFPDGVAALQYLVAMNAFSNSFTGPLPPEISGVNSLRVLNLAGSYFEGLIPPQYGSLSNLELLDLAGNSLSDKLPPELGYLQKVTHMELGYNSYWGGIPPEMGNMTELQYLDIAEANISGPIPPQLSNLTKLRSLYLFRNHLTGSIPHEFGSMISLVSLDLSDNLLTGAIPDTFLNLTNLQLLSLMYNSMTGSVPIGLAELPLLDTLLIWSNSFSGLLPSNLGKNSPLKWLDVSSNNFSGRVPSGLCAARQLYKLMLFSNHFTDGLSSAISNCTSLVRLRVEDNSFTEAFPLTFTLLPNLTYADLSRNQFTGRLPLDIASAQNLQYLNVSSNPTLGRDLPDGVWTLPHLQNFSASSCNISGHVPAFKTCGSISVIELDRNSFSGAIPQTVSRCSSLWKLHLANNKFTGSIPSELAALPKLTILDLSHNRLTGALPLGLGESSTLSLMNLSFNNISGTVPQGTIFRSVSPSALMGNPLLCGFPLQPCRSTKKLPAGFGVGIWVLSLCVGVTLASVLLFHLLHRRSRTEWNIISFHSFPRFKANDIFRNLSYDKMADTEHSTCKAVLPTGTTVTLRKIEWRYKNRAAALGFITQIGNARHKNLVRLLGFCCNNHGAYLIYEYLSNGSLMERMKMKIDPRISKWTVKCKLVLGIAKGLCYLHHSCSPSMAHGDISATNVVFDENMEPRLAGTGLKYLQRMNGRSFTTSTSVLRPGEIDSAIKEWMHEDVFNYGALVLDILTNGRLKGDRQNSASESRESILKEMCHENEDVVSDSEMEEMKLFLHVALLCTRRTQSDRPSMENVVNLLTGAGEGSLHTGSRSSKGKL